MYQPNKYRNDTPSFIYNFILQNPFATLVVDAQGLIATHIPVLTQGAEKDFILYSHIANNNPMKNYLTDGKEALLIFQGANGYVSSSWYNEVDISTWDYSAVHISAKIKLQTSEELAESLEKMVEMFEKNQENPLYYDQIPKDILIEHIPLITGFWCIPFKMEGIAKLHQGFNEKDIDSITRNLEKQNDPRASELGKQIKKEHGRNY